MTPGQYQLALADLRAWPKVDVILRSGREFKSVVPGKYENATLCVRLMTAAGLVIVLGDEIAALSAADRGVKA